MCWHIQGTKRVPEIHCITKKGGRKRKIWTILFPTYLLTCLNKDTSVLLKVKIFEQVQKLSIKTMVLTF